MMAHALLFLTQSKESCPELFTIPKLEDCIMKKIRAQMIMVGIFVLCYALPVLAANGSGP
jgi:hypothetical protein